MNERDPEVKSKTDDAIKAQNAKILAKSRTVTFELLTVVETGLVCFLRVSCARNARKVWLSLKEHYMLTTVAEELQLVKKFNSVRLQSARKNPVEIF